jgi:hypothetical protein
VQGNQQKDALDGHIGPAYWNSVSVLLVQARLQVAARVTLCKQLEVNSAQAQAMSAVILSRIITNPYWLQLEIYFHQFSLHR